MSELEPNDVVAYTIQHLVRHLMVKESCNLTTSQYDIKLAIKQLNPDFTDKKIDEVYNQLIKQNPIEEYPVIFVKTKSIK